MAMVADDAELWNAYRSDDKEALGTLAERYYRTLRRYGLKFRVDEAVVEDCIQDLFLQLWQNRRDINPTPSVRNYLLRSLRSHILLYLRQRQHFVRENLDWELILPDAVNAESLLIEQETLSALIARISNQLADLPKREREALFLRYYENLSVAEIAEVMNVNRQSVSNFLQKAMLKLREKWPIGIIVAFSIIFLKNFL